MYSQVGAGFQDYRLQHLQSGFSQKGFKHQNGYLLFGFQEMNLCRERISWRSHEGEFQLSLGSVGHRDIAGNGCGF